MTTVSFAKMAVVAGIFLARLHAQTLPLLPPPPGQSIDDFINELQNDINNAARNGGLIPGNAAGSGFEVCINGKITVFSYFAYVTSSGTVSIENRLTSPTSNDCKTSTDFMQLDLDNQDSLMHLLHELTTNYNGAAGLDSKAATDKPAAQANTLPSLLPQFTGVPFLPFYDRSRYPTQLPCSQSSAPDVYLVNHASSTVTRYNSCSLQTIATIFVQSNPLQVAVTADGSLAVVTSFDGAINFINTTTNQATIVQTPNLNPSGIDITPDGAFAYVTGFDSVNNFLVKVDLTQQKIVQTLRMPAQYPQSVTLNPEGSQAYVMFPFDPRVVVVDTLTMTVTNTINLPGAAFGTAFNSTGTLAFIGTRTTPGTIQVINPATYQVMKAITVGDNPTDLFVLDDQLLLTGNYYGMSLSLIDIPSLRLINTVALPGNPRGLVQTQ